MLAQILFRKRSGFQDIPPWLKIISMNLEIKPGFFAPRIRFALASLLIAGLLLFLFLPRNDGSFRAVPAQTALLLECKGLLRARIMIDKMPDLLWREVLHSTLFNRCFEAVYSALQLFKHDPKVLSAFAKNKSMAAFSLHPADSLHALFVLELDEDLNLEKALKTNKHTPKYFPHQFHGNDIFTVYLSKTEQLEVAVSGRLLLFSHRATLVEDALAQLENAHNWWADRPLIHDLPDATLRFHLRPSALAEQLRSQMKPHWRSLPDLLARNIEWLGLSWDGTELKTLAETNGFLSNLSNWGETPGNLIFNVLPDNTAFLARTGLGNIPDFFRKIGQERSGDFEQYVEPWAGAEAAFAVTEPLSPGLTGDRLVLIAVHDSAMAVSKLRAYGKANGTLPAATGTYQMFEVLCFQNSSLLKPLLGDDEAFRNPVCCLVGGYAVFAPDRSSLEVFLDKYLVNQTLAANTDFLQLQQKIPIKGPASSLLNTTYLPGLMQNITSANVAPSFTRIGFIHAVLQPRSGRKAQLTLSTQALSQPFTETDILWKVGLSKPMATQPYLVEQPTGKTVVLIQDLDNNLHCLDAQNGTSVWNRSLPQPIRSEVNGVDFYDSGAKCYTFSTSTHLYMVDEKGRDVEGFPFKLSATATNGATVVNFDKDTKLSYFVACENGKIYGFGHWGKPLDGWNALPANGNVRQPILHFQHNGKDYLAVLTDAGLLSVYGRNGTLRFDPVQLSEAKQGGFSSPLQVDLDASSPRIYCANTGGKVFACDLQGNVSSWQVGNPGSVIAFGQLTGDARFEWAVLEGKNLIAGVFPDGTNTRASQIFKTRLPEKQHLLFFSKNNRIGTVNTQGRRLWLLDKKGNTIAGFPLGGNTEFRLTRLNGVDMLVSGNINGVWAYRLR
jgi:Protein of unknown function (DUF3352)/PQQ-like domain